MSSPPPVHAAGNRLPANMPPAAATVRSAAWVSTLALLVGVLAFVYAALFAYCFDRWVNQPDYSHGFLVPFFAAYLAWYRQQWVPHYLRWPDPWGLVFIGVGALLFYAAGRFNIAKEWLQGLSFVINLCGAALLLGGWPTLRWLAPSLAFLMFMFPLPFSVERALGWQLQKIAAIASEFTLQTIGYPTYREGVVLTVDKHTLEVERACSGLSMLLTFAALAVGMVLVTTRPWLDKGLVLVSAIPVAVVSNVLRITLTGILYNTAGKELGDRVFHDFAGWLMMPLALLILWGELKLLDWILVDTDEKVSGQEVIRANARNPAHLIMTALPSEKGGSAPNPMKPASQSAPKPGAW